MFTCFVSLLIITTAFEVFTCQFIYCQQGVVLALVLYDNQNLLFLVLPIIYTCLCLYPSLNVVNVVNKFQTPV